MKRIFLLLIALMMIAPFTGAANYLSDYNSYKVMHFHMNGTGLSTTFIEETGKAVTRTAPTVIQSSPYAFGNASGYNDGSGVETLSDSADFAMGSGDFTIMSWVYPATLDGINSNIIYGQSDASVTAASRQNQFTIISTKNPQFSWWDAGTTRHDIACNTTLKTGIWYQFVIQKSGNTIIVYQNGLPVGQETVAGLTENDASGKMGVFGTGEYSSGRLSGYIDELVMWKGVAIPISELYPEEVEVGAINPTPVIPYFTTSTTATTTGVSVSFNDTSLGLPTGWAWMFGDEPYTNPWTSVALTTPRWSARQSFQMITTKSGDLLVLGGVTSGTVENNETYRSINNGTIWSLIDSNAPWTARDSHGAVVNSYGDIIMMGGYTGAAGGSPVGSINDTWKSTDQGKTWTRVNSNGGWLPRYGFGCVILPNDHIVISGGTIWDPTERVFNDTWRSVDNGTTWTQMSTSPGWEKRQYPAMVALQDGSIVLIGGAASPTGAAAGYHKTNDTWKSTDEGATWTLVNASSGSSARTTATAVAMQDSSILLIGGWDGTNYLNDVWRTTNSGTTWTRVNASAGFTPRWIGGATISSNGSVIIAGGQSGSYLNDVYQFQPSSAFINNATHAYSAAGTYTPSLVVANQSLRVNSTLKLNYITVGSGGIPLTASFTATPTPSTLGQSVAFTDTSTGSPTTWNWTFGDTGTSTLQNPTHTYTFHGTYPVYLNVTNATGGYSNVSSLSMVVNNATNFTQQDIWQAGAYVQTFHITDASTAAPIADVTITDSNGQTFTATNGTGYLTEPAGVVVWYFVSSGYSSASLTGIVDGDATHDIQLTKTSTTNQNTNLVYTPHLVRLRVTDLYSQPLTPVALTVNYVASTLPSSDTTYLQNAFGVSAIVAEQMTNSSLAMAGETGTDGSNTFTMFPAISYHITMVNASQGVNCQVQLAPIDSDYVLHCAAAGQEYIANNTEAAKLNRSYIWYNEPNASFVTYNAQYQDSDCITTDAAFNVTFVDNSTTAYYHDFGNPGCSLVTANYTLPNVRGFQVKAFLTYTRSA